jgi:lambda repressor-like predicted transcriptional regulator
MFALRPKRELIEWFRRFWADKERGISMELLVEFTGVSKKTLEEVARRGNRPMQDWVQSALSKFAHEWEAGMIEVYQRPNRTKAIRYRREPVLDMRPSVGLQVVDGQIRLNVGLKNRANYMTPTLKEQLNGR